MKVQYFSDIHIEFTKPVGEIVDPAADVIIAAGDIGTGIDGLRWLQSMIKNKPVVYVAGNHESYHNDIVAVRNALKYLSEGTNIFVLDDSKVEFDGVTFMGGTLWTDLTITGRYSAPVPVYYGAAAVKQGINDQKTIRHNDGPFTSEHWLNMHGATKFFLKTEFAAMNPQKTVVVTHHLPFPQSIDERYEGDTSNAGFASDLSDLLYVGMPKYWIHGHTHHPCDYMVGDTRVLCNPRGYTNDRGGVENKDFSWNTSFEI
jgi:predicted phosphodiesterase